MSPEEMSYRIGYLEEALGSALAHGKFSRRLRTLLESTLEQGSPGVPPTSQNFSIGDTVRVKLSQNSLLTIYQGQEGVIRSHGDPVKGQKGYHVRLEGTSKSSKFFQNELELVSRSGSL